MGLIGIIIASLVNLFLRSSGLDWMISIIGVGVFAGLTAYDTQRIKGMHDGGDDATVAGRKAVMGALSLYLNFPRRPKRHEGARINAPGCAGRRN